MSVRQIFISFFMTSEHLLYTTLCRFVHPWFGCSWLLMDVVILVKMYIKSVLGCRGSTFTKSVWLFWKILRIGTDIFRSSFDFQLIFKIVKGWFPLGLQAADAQLPSPVYNLPQSRGCYSCFLLYNVLQLLLSTI